MSPRPATPHAGRVVLGVLADVSASSALAARLVAAYISQNPREQAIGVSGVGMVRA